MTLINPKSQSAKPRNYHNCVKTYCYPTGLIKNIPDRRLGNISDINLVGVWKIKYYSFDS